MSLRIAHYIPTSIFPLNQITCFLYRSYLHFNLFMSVYGIGANTINGLVIHLGNEDQSDRKKGNFNN
jgi:hypothetical protein